MCDDPGRQQCRRGPAGRARIRRADRLRPARRGRADGADARRSGSAGEDGGGRDRPPRPTHPAAERARCRPHPGRLTQRLSELGADPSQAMAPFVPALDAFHESTRPSTWLEGLVKAYVGDGLASDFYREIAAFLPHPDRALVMDVLADTGHADFAVREVRAAIRANRTVAGRLALWGRRLVGEAISQSQAVIAEHDQLAELIIAGTGDLAGIGRLIERITAAHTDRMKRLGLNP